MKRLVYLARIGLLALIPILVAAICSVRPPPATDEARRIVVRGILDEIVYDFLVVTPFATLTPTPTPTPTITATVIAGRPDSGPERQTGTPEVGIGGGTPASGGLSTPAVLPTLPPPPIASPTSPPLPTATVVPTPIPLPTPTWPPIPSPTFTGVPSGGGGLPPPLPPPTNTPGPPVISFSSAVYNVGEGVGSAIITVILSHIANQVVTVDFSTGTGSAFPPNDYTPASGTLTFAVGETGKSFSVPIVDDQVDDPDIETIPLTLSNPTNGSLGIGNATLQITDNDPLPIIMFDSLTYLTLESATPVFTITLNRPSGKSVTVTYGPNGSSSDTATAGTDYTIPGFGVKAFGPDATGVSSTTLTITWPYLINDADVTLEPNETVEIEIFDPPVTTNFTRTILFTTTLIISDP